MSMRIVAMVAAIGLSSGLSSPALAASPAAIGGIGLQYCANVTGAANAPNLAQAVDWAMGYFAGRIDAGQTPAASGPLTGDPIDAAVAIVSFCLKTPEATVLDALRDRATGVFASHAAPAAPLVEDLAPASPFELPVSLPRPRPRPDRSGDRFALRTTGAM